MPREPDQDVAARVVQALSAALSDRLVAVVLFGSRSRGEAEAESDWDLLVVVRDLPAGPLERLVPLKQLLPPGCEGVSLLLRTPEEFTDHVSSLHLDIALDGKVLYDPQGYMADRLSHLRRLVENMGLYRERTEAGHEWRWKKPPTGRWTPNLRG
jgi:predicted nucleotidyltransferase